MNEHRTFELNTHVPNNTINAKQYDNVMHWNTGLETNRFLKAQLGGFLLEEEGWDRLDIIFITSRYQASNTYIF